MPIEVDRQGASGRGIEKISGVTFSIQLTLVREDKVAEKNFPDGIQIWSQTGGSFRSFSFVTNAPET